MRVGFIGTGKLGLPVSIVYSTKGHELLCYDTNPVFYNDSINLYDNIFDEELCPENKIKLKDWLPARSTLNYCHTDLKTIVEKSDLIFLAVQTPHNKEFEGTTRLPENRIDFDYSYLINSIKSLSLEAQKVDRDIPIIIISTVLPGTIRREIVPLLSLNLKLCYNPYFIAMGSVAYDCLNPEFILLGHHDDNAKKVVETFYSTISNSHIFSTTLENAELIKVCYNTFISTKIALANTIMELCYHSPNTDCDSVIDALSLANRRLISTAYLRGGMGDGGGCHPRDNIALSWYSKEKGLKYDWFESIMIAREKQCEFLVDIIEQKYNETKLPIFIIGLSFKANTGIQTGSPAILLTNLLLERKIQFKSLDPVSNKIKCEFNEVGIYFIGCNHSIFNSYVLPVNSILIDPYRSFEKMLPSGTYIPLGKNIIE